MPVTAEALDAKLRAALPVAHLEIVDESSGCGENYNVLIVSEVRATHIQAGPTADRAWPPGRRRLKARRRWRDIA